MVLKNMWFLRFFLYMYLFLLSNVSLGINAPLMAIDGAPTTAEFAKIRHIFRHLQTFFGECAFFFVSCWYVDSYITQKYTKKADLRHIAGKKRHKCRKYGTPLYNRGVSQIEHSSSQAYQTAHKRVFTDKPKNQFSLIWKK